MDNINNTILKCKWCEHESDNMDHLKQHQNAAHVNEFKAVQIWLCREDWFGGDWCSPDELTRKIVRLHNYGAVLPQ